MSITICKINSINKHIDSYISFLKNNFDLYPSNKKNITDIVIIKDSSNIFGFYKITNLVSQYSKNNFTIYFDCKNTQNIHTLINNINNDINYLKNKYKKCKIEIITKDKFINYFSDFDLDIINNTKNGTNVLLYKYF